MTDLEISEIIIIKCRTVDTILEFLREFDIDIKKINKGLDKNSRGFAYRDLRKLYSYSYKDETLYESSSIYCETVFLQKLLKILDPDKKEILKNTVMDLRKRMLPQKSKSSAKKEGITNNFYNSNNAVANNTNIIDISTLIDLSIYISQSTQIENKQELLELVKELNESEKENDKDTYLDLLFKLLEKLQDDTGLLPKWLANSIKIVKKFTE